MKMTSGLLVMVHDLRPNVDFFLAGLGTDPLLPLQQCSLDRTRTFAVVVVRIHL